MTQGMGSFWGAHPWLCTVHFGHISASSRPRFLPQGFPGDTAERIVPSI